jgi:NTP pyrophosphatase (non-canonical NTP hydrolase)
MFSSYNMEGEMHKPWEKMDTKERTDSLKDEIADVRRQLATLTGTLGEIGGAVKNLEKAMAKLKG